MILLVLLLFLVLAPPVRAQSARQTLESCIQNPEQHTIAECDAAYQRWKTVRADRFKSVAQPASQPILAVPQVADMNESAVTWFGSIDSQHNYADVRLAYSGNSLTTWVSVIDRYLYSTADAVELKVGNGNTQRVNLSLNTPWRGNSFNDQVEDRGWIAQFKVDGVQTGQVLPLTVTLRDEKKAPQTFNTTIRLGPEPFTPASGSNPETREVAVERDASVGGGGTCATEVDPSFFDKLGSFVRVNSPDFNVQNQGDIADWPCFSKYYGIWPAISGKVAKAELVLHQFGNAGGAEWNPPAERSLIQVATTDVWTGNLSWNTGPAPHRVVGRGWIDLMRVPLVWPGVERVIDVTPAVESGKPTSLVLYTGDLHYHSGKYFVAKATGDWNAAGRPKLRVTTVR